MVIDMYWHKEILVEAQVQVVPLLHKKGPHGQQYRGACKDLLSLERWEPYKNVVVLKYLPSFPV